MYGRVVDDIVEKPYGHLFTQEEDHGFRSFSLDSPIVQAAAGREHSLFLTEDGRVWSLGLDELCLGRSDGHVLSEITDFREAEVNVTSLGAGDGMSVVLTEEGDVISWGQGKDGRLGHGNNQDMSHPSSMEFFEELSAKQIGVGNNFGMALVEGGRVFAWGKNEQGQLGQGGGLLMDMHNIETLPVEVDFDDKPIKKISCGYDTAGAIDEDGVAYFWGGKDNLSPLAIELENPAEKAVDIFAGSRFAIIASDAGHLYSVGRGKTGSLGLGDQSTQKVGKLISFFEGMAVNKVVCGPEQVAAIAN